MKISLIIPVYKNIIFLDMVIESLKIQSYKEFELIITEDAAEEEMKKYIDKKKEELTFSVTHITQEDKGYRRNKALNNGLRIAKGRLIIVIDGDCMVHPKFIEEYIKAYNEGDCFIGRRQELGPRYSEKIIKNHKVKLSFLEIFLSDSKKKEHKEALYLWGIKRKSNKLTLLGSHFAVKREFLLKINGFDEDYISYGMEDCDLEWRLRKSGAKFVSMKGRAIQYHLWHKKNSSARSSLNLSMYEEKIKLGNFVCINGLEKLEDK